MEDHKMPGRRLLQLAIKDAIQSRLCLVSPIMSQMEREKRDRRNKSCTVNEITIRTGNSHQNSRPPQNIFVHEDMKGKGSCAYEVKHNYPSNLGLHTVKIQDKHLPSSRYTFDDNKRNELSSQCMENNYISAPINSKSKSQDMLQFSTASRKKSDIMPASVDCKYSWRNVKLNSTSYDFDQNSANPPATHQAFVDSQLICSNSDCDSKSGKVPITHSNTELDCNYDLPMFSQSYESSKTSDNNFEGLGASKLLKEDYVSEIPKMNSDLLKHLTLHSFDNSSIQSEKESLSSNNFIQPQAGSHWFNVSEQNTLSNCEIEIPVPKHSVDQTYSSTCNVTIPDQEHFDSFSDNSIPNDKMIAQKSLSHANDDTDFFKNNTFLNHCLKSDPHFSTLKHFRGLLTEKNPPLITVTTDNLELKIVTHQDDYDTEFPIPKPHAIRAEESGTRNACERGDNINRHDCLLDYFLSLNDESMHDETSLVSSTLPNMNTSNDKMSFGNNQHSAKPTGNIFYPEVYDNNFYHTFESNCKKSNLEKLTCTNSHNLLHHFPDSVFALLNMDNECSKSNPRTNDHLHNKRNNDNVIYARNFTAKQSSTGIFPSNLQSETLNQNYFNSESNFSNPTNSLFNKDVSMAQMCSSVSDNALVNHFDSLNSGHYSKTNTLNNPNATHDYCNKSKLGRSSKVLSSSSCNNSSFRTDLKKHSVSQFGICKHDCHENSTLTSKSLDKVSCSLDSGIGLMPEDHGYNSKLDLPLISSKQELNVLASMQEKMHDSDSKTIVTSDYNTEYLQLYKNNSSPTKCSLSKPLNEYENARIQDLIDKFKNTY